MDRRDALKALGGAASGALVVTDTRARPAKSEVVEFDLLCTEAGSQEFRPESMTQEHRLEHCTLTNPRNGTVWQIGRGGPASAPRLPWFERGKRYRIMIPTTPLPEREGR